ncbi:hypothetical protein [Kutzneria chonburiensis]|uniref:Uncharacterized protein n=1 Tax=Kutzneria chonburiensis TaxID=1483604 RepID=A0ABV6N4E0_9PSEU|nr:hypothetical protein [Kutzneria chonburiensis]
MIDCAFCDTGECIMCGTGIDHLYDPDLYDADLYTPEPSPWANHIFELKVDGEDCADDACVCLVQLLSDAKRETVAYGSGDAMRWNPSMPIARFGPS